MPIHFLLTSVFDYPKLPPRKLQLYSTKRWIRMRPFLVVVRPDSGVSNELIETTFKHSRSVVPNVVWAVAGDDNNTMPGEICEKLGFGEEGGRTGIIVTLDQYNGYFDATLWETLAKWRNT